MAGVYVFIFNIFVVAVSISRYTGCKNRYTNYIARCLEKKIDKN